MLKTAIEQQITRTGSRCGTIYQDNGKIVFQLVPPLEAVEIPSWLKPGVTLRPKGIFQYDFRVKEVDSKMCLGKDALNNDSQFPKFYETAELVKNWQPIDILTNMPYV